MAKAKEGNYYAQHRTGFIPEGPSVDSVDRLFMSQVLKLF